ncbi:MAG: ABC transporter ATP-binding protein [Sarcina sp.]
MSYLRVENLSKSFGDKEVLKDINLEINEGEFLCLLGPSGCGKTTLLRIIAGLEDLNGGEIFLLNNDITKLEPSKRGFGIVFQSYALFPNMTAYKNIEFALKQKKLDKQQIEKKIAEVLEIVGLTQEGSKYPRELSGGQQQRIAIARAIALEPKFLLLDEPMSALDAKVRAKLRLDIKKLQKKLGITTIMVTHDQEEAITMADRIAVLDSGKIMQIDTPEQIYQRPQNLFTAQFIGETNCLNINGEVCTIRPEYVEVYRHTHLGKKGQISNLEFRGSTIRAEIKPENQLYGDVIISDIPMKQWVDLGLKEEDKITFDFNDEYYIKYEVSVGA